MLPLQSFGSWTSVRFMECWVCNFVLNKRDPNVGQVSIAKQFAGCEGFWISICWIWIVGSEYWVVQILYYNCFDQSDLNTHSLFIGNANLPVHLKVISKWLAQLHLPMHTPMITVLITEHWACVYNNNNVNNARIWLLEYTLSTWWFELEYSDLHPNFGPWPFN